MQDLHKAITNYLQKITLIQDIEWLKSVQNISKIVITRIKIIAEPQY